MSMDQFTNGTPVGLSPSENDSGDLSTGMVGGGSGGGGSGDRYYPPHSATITEGMSEIKLGSGMSPGSGSSFATAGYPSATNSLPSSPGASAPLQLPAPGVGSGMGAPSRSQEITEKLDTIKKWSVSTFKCTRQMVSEKLGKGTRTVDPELEGQIEVLRETQRRYQSLLKLAKALNNHFFYVVQTQRQLAESFGDLAQKNPELHEEFTCNADTQRTLVRNGETLLGALNFYISSMDTLCNKTIEDTLTTVKQFEAARLEFDAYRVDLETVKSVAASSPRDQVKVSEADRQYHIHRACYDRLKQDVTIKLKFLDENRMKVMRKQLVLFHNAISAYFAGNQSALEATLKQFNIKLRGGNAEPRSWLESP